MPLSPCSFRSAQCAALIALAAAAGIARVETATTGQTNARQPSVERDHSNDRTAGWSFFHLAARTSAPWLQRAAAFAAWIVGGKEPNVTETGVGRAPDPATAAALAASPTWAWAPAIPVSDVRPVQASFTFSLCTVIHALPFAVGPPRLDRSLPRFAAGTLVPGDNAANGVTVSVVAPDEDSSLARLARPSFPHPQGVGFVSLPGPGFALRGTPSRPSRCALTPLRASTHRSALYSS